MKNSKDEIQLEKDLLIETLKAQVKHYKKKLVKIKKQLSLCSVSNCTICKSEINYKGVCEMCYTK